MRSREWVPNPRRSAERRFMRISMLGAFQVELNGKSDFTPDPPKERTVLALIALHANRVVSIDTIIGEIWGDGPPRTSVATARTYIYHLRKIFIERLGPAGVDLLATKTHGYLLRLAEDMVDANIFCGLVAKGRQLLSDDQPEDAAITLREALDMWRGPALGNVPLGQTLSAYATFLEEERRSAKELRIMADMRLGRHRELISEIRSLVVEDPVNEWLSAQLMITLSRCGRRGEALGVYADLRSQLATQLGLDPSRDLQRLHHQVLVADQQPVLFS
ncbi:BTAD domain-containing putative transcriptional regulator [Nonomuraea sp. NPDC050022]